MMIRYGALIRFYNMLRYLTDHFHLPQQQHNKDQL